ncbi:hypothetical protein VNO78_21571 [Psophocarpus tetragonolobus]|uniref:Uncharacterized protein n=1 Tax=Psophocarpus tetragonolobus TaxID=3891 RepID=A0AAN9SGT1_PSOTE
MKTEIVSKATIKPSSPTPHHLQNFKLSLLDQLAPSFYVPILFFYSTPFGINTNTISHNLKTSLSQILTLYYPFCGTLRGNSTIECNDEGVPFIESRLPIELSNVMKNPTLYVNELFPCDPYNPKEGTLGNCIMEVQLNHFMCGGVALAVCFSHKTVDGSTAASFLIDWAAISSKKYNEKIAPPKLQEGEKIFPTRKIEMDMTEGMFGDKNIATKRFIFNSTNISKLRQKLTRFNFNPTRVEAITALIWKSSLEAAKASSGEKKFPAFMISHAINIRSRIVPTLSNHSVGNLWYPAMSQLVEVEEEMGLYDLVTRVREMLENIAENYLTLLQGDEFYKVIENLKEAKVMALEKGVSCYVFSSWVRFGFYEVDFGWGKPSYVQTIGVPIKNVVILMGRKVGDDDDGIEAWVTLSTRDMVQFEQNPELLEFVSIDP